MPDIYDREMARLMRASREPMTTPLSEIVLDLEQLQGEAEAGGASDVAAAIGAAAALGRLRLIDADVPARRSDPV